MFDADTSAGWVERNLGRALAPMEGELVELLCRAYRTGPWNLQPWRSLDTAGRGACRVLDHELATFDSDALTRLVIGAHDACRRVSIHPHTFRHLRILYHPRERDGDMMRRHPTMDEAVASFRGVPRG